MNEQDDMTNENGAKRGGSKCGIVYCRCAYAKVVPEAVKDQVLEQLCASGRAFDTVADLCETSARRDPAMRRIAERAARGDVKIAACYPRAVRGLFEAADAKLPGDTAVLNMREQTADEIVAALLEDRGANEERS